MLIRLNHTYLLVAGLLYFVFWFSTSSYYVPLFMLHLFNFSVYFFILNYNSKNRFIRSSKKLAVLSTIFIFSAVLVAANNIASLSYSNNFFVFSEADAFAYHINSLRIASKTFFDSVGYIFSTFSYEDAGSFLIISTLYRLAASNLILNFFNVIFGLITAFGIYRIAYQFMSLRHAFVCTVAYSLSSFVLWFHSSGLKESFMIMLVVLFFDRYILYVKNKRILHLVYMSMFVSALILFRPVLIFFCVGAIGMGILLQRKRGLWGGVLVFLVFTTFFGLYDVFESNYERFLKSGDIERMLEEKESMIRVNTQFTYLTNFVAQVVGPLPTIKLVDNKIYLSFFSAGLIYRALLSFFFWAGVYYVFKFKEEQLYPFVFFIFFEMISLFAILEGLELRKSLPHFSMIYIVAFWFMDKFDHAAYFKNKRMNQKIRILFGFSTVSVFAIIWYWNIRFQVV